MPRARVQLRVAHEQLHHLVRAAALGVALERKLVLLAQLVVQPAAVVQRAPPLAVVLVVELPEQIIAEYWPKPPGIRLFRQELGCNALEFIEHLARAAAAAQEPGQLGAEGLEGRELHYQAPRGEVQAREDQLVKIAVELAPHGLADLGAVALAREQVPYEQVQGQGTAPPLCEWRRGERGLILRIALVICAGLC